MHLILAYIKFLWRSKNQHGVHSPFVYNLVTQCFYDKAKRTSYHELEKFRKRLFQNKKSIKVCDFGAGSRVFSSEERKISHIAKNAGISSKRSRILNRIVPFLKIQNALELGTSVGLGTAAMAMGNKVQITSLEGCPQTASVAREGFEFFNLKNINLEVGSFEDLLPKQKNRQWDLIYFDGNHQKKATLKYFEELLPSAHNDSVFIFDDIHWSKEMEEAWAEIKKHPQVRVSIDTFYWGMVFFRQEQAREHFTIRL